ncbi:MAG: NAD-dependent epimerase/dehydratase family protein [Planctomycetes bacterium]|nr:NAD-dependent epimerase/dehydratase family protein [Planctomycetota bacterium]
MSGRRILIAGCGYVGSSLARQLADLGDTPFAARRSPAELPAELPDDLPDDLPDRVQSVAIDLLDGDLAALPDRLDAVVWAVSPGRDEPAYRRAYVDGPRRLLRFLADRGDRLQRAVLVGSTSVWHRDDGAFVDERTPPSPKDYRGRAVLDGEQVLADAPCRSIALRFAGIYGPGRTRLLDAIARGERTIPTRAIHGNRIWRDDGAKAIAHVLSLDDPAPVYVVSDDDPADLREVYTHLAERLGAPPPQADSEFSSRGGDKRCRNDLLRGTGFVPDVPDYRIGYARLIRSR